MLRKIKHIITLFILTIVMTNLYGQDPHFSQFYANPLYMSPSLAGSTDGGRLIANYRNQWPGINKAFETYSISFDNFFPSLNSGLGFMLYQDKAGSAGLTTTQFTFQYSYNLIINDEWQLIPGIQFSYGNKFIDFNKLEFGDEMQGVGGSGSWNRLNNERANYIDFAASAFLYSSKYWFGLTIDHLAQPNYSFLNEEMRFPLKTVLFGGVNIWNEKRRGTGSARSFSLSYRLQQQAKDVQMDLGVYWFNDPIEIGIWYRGLPFITTKNSTSINQDAIVALLSYKYGPLRFGYSYDVSLSGLGWNAQGAHELSVIFEFNQRMSLRMNGKRPALPCSETANPLSSTSRSKYKRKKRRVF
ncbi:PorP/SprF family type IX secretion system membrane protein [Labilibacter marinus]|uniref:PorP/SprF family type IX secretion system membrane protein n=1 Tax=Labilibacter marinus TaxID=1477105 RepID=UPI00082AC7FC|nr:PorP/SprF family type IX secretion system membrane protein [Labilibacter marinus]